MGNVEKQIAVIYSGKDSPNFETEELIRYMVAKTLRNHQDYKAGPGKLYIAADSEEETDLSKEPAADILLFEFIEERDDVEEARRLAYNANKGARIFVPLGSSFITKDLVGPFKTILTYSLSDQNANICSNRIIPRSDGGFDLEVVYQSDPLGKGSLRNRIFPGFNKNMFGKAAVNSTDRADILTVIKAYSIGMALSIETKYLRDGISPFVFESMAKKIEEDRLAKANEPKTVARSSREKEFDPD
ncbi:MAG: hypothetical protein IKS99_02100 [Firmicutes bacterium]|nr:hypothetical protein [Bacillota bacterium]